MVDLDGLYNELVCLSEIAGELSPEDNAKIDARIRELRFEIEKLEKAGY